MRKKLTAKSENSTLTREFVGYKTNNLTCYIDGAYAPEASKRTCSGRKDANGKQHPDCAACRVLRNSLGVRG